MGLTAKEYATLHDKIASGKASADEVKQVQQYLVDKGFNVKIDGDAGPKTMAAMDKYVKTNYTADSEAEGSSAETAGDVNSEMANEGDEYSLSSDKLDALGQSAVNKLKSSSEYNAASQKEAEAIDKFKRGKEYARQDVANITQAGVDAIKLTQAINQIKQGQKAAAELKGNRPQMPQALPSQPLQKAAQDAEAAAQYGMGDRTKGYVASRDLSAYANALAAARTAGAGQANLVGSAAQGLYGETLNRNLAAGAQDEAARLGKAQFSAELANAQASEQSMNQARQLQYGYAPKLEEWQIANAEARGLTQAGNRNMSNILSMAPYRAANLAYQYYNSPVQRGNAPVPGSPQWEQQQAEQAKFNQQKAIENLARRQATENLIKGKLNSAGSWIQDQGQNVKSWYDYNLGKNSYLKNYQDAPVGPAPQDNYYGIPQNYLG
jgi:hypothetical protein